MTSARGGNKAEQFTTDKARWQPVAGFTWELFFIALAWVIAFISVVPMFYWVMQGNSPSTLLWTCFWGGFAAIYGLTVWLSNKYRARQRKNLVTAQELLASDPRPPVLYLRSFKDDETTSRLLNLSTEEQELAVTMIEIGPFITFGEPGKEVPEPGAARMYVGNEHWQNHIKDLMSNAQLVVGRIANTDSFMWEMATAKDLVVPERLLLLLPEHEQEYDKFRRNVREVFPTELPEHRFRWHRSAFHQSHISSEGLLYFEPDWTPHVQTFPPASLRQTYWMPGVPTLKMALRPVYEQLGIEWKRPPLQPAMVTAAALLILIALFVIYVGVLQILEFIALIRKYL